MKIKKRYFETWTQIIILIVATLAFSYFVHESSIQDITNEKGGINKLSMIMILLLSIVNKIIWSEKTIVSALGEDVLKTCVSTCSEYLSEECDAKCNGDCIPIRAGDIAECKIGTCLNQVEGTCASGTHKKTCESVGGEWLNDPNGNVQQCKKGCCLNGGRTIFETERACARNAELSGIDKVFRSEINTEAACLISGASSEEGACLLNKDIITGQYNCKFLTRSSCNAFKGDFHSGILCSNKELNTKCEEQATTSCVQGKPEVYWFDSCGNKENIYDINNAERYSGMVLSKSESCSLTDGNRGTCGNCDYLSGSGCGLKTTTEKLSDGTQNVVCRDLGCDENGDGKKDREHGESWCAYQGAIGEEGNRAVDTPGSRHFRMVCAYGEISIEPCGEGRGYVCTENEASNGFSSAVCRINGAATCLGYNNPDENEDKTKAMEDCANNADCFVKTVDLGKYFRFSVCAPKYAPSADLKTGVGSVCSDIGAQSCTTVYVKKLFGGWKCKANCACLTPAFAQQMNDLCMSMGDCGASVNYDRELSTGGASFTRAGLTQDYLNGLKTYSEPISGKVVPVGNLTDVINSLWIPNNVDVPTEFKSTLDQENWFTGTMQVSGVAGILLYEGVKYEVISLAEYEWVDMASGYDKIVLEPTTWGSVAPILGAAAGYAVVAYFIKAFGIGPGLPSYVVYTALAAGAYAGASILAGGAGEGFLAAGPVGWIILAIIILILYIFKVMGVGKTKEKVSTFTCGLWQPPRGGDNCDRCGKDGFKCSEYACESLGGTCEFKNEGTSEEICLNVDDGNPTAPIIIPGAISEGYRFEDSSDLGVRIKSTEGDGCVGAFSSVRFTINLSKPGSCRYSSSPFDTPVINVGEETELSDEEFANFLAEDIKPFSNGIIRGHHSLTIIMPSAESLGLAAYDPTERTDYNIYVRCANAAGNEANRDYLINMCAKPGTDITPPLITIGEPSGNFVKYDATEQTLKVFTNEPANCSWSTGDVVYRTMENKMECKNGMGDQTARGWACNSSLPINSDESKFYIRCADKPWENNDSNVIVNDESTSLILKKTSEMKITYAKPNNETLVFSTPIGSVNLEVRTSGGMSGGPTCMASFDGINYYVVFDTTNGETHKVTLSAVTSGDKKIWLKCEDRVGNIAFEEINFGVDIDIDAPKITSIYSIGGSLTIKTNEPADCALSLSECSFNFANGTLMTGAGFEHTFSVEKNKIYYAKCKDKVGNVGGMCDSKFKVV